MPMGYRGIDPSNSAYVELEGFRALTDDGAADIICHFALRYEEGRCSGEQLVAECLRALCMTRRYGTPYPLPSETLQAHLTAATEDVLRKPVPAHLYGERS